MLTGCPPSELLVTVVITSGTLPALSRNTRSSAATSMFPLNGCRTCGWCPSGMGMLRATAPRCSMLPRVVSKCVLFGTMSPGLSMALLRMCSAARPWCVGITWVKPVMSCTARSKVKNDRAPAYVSSPFIIPAHWYTDMAPVPESVSRSMSTSSPFSRKTL